MSSATGRLCSYTPREYGRTPEVHPYCAHGRQEASVGPMTEHRGVRSMAP